MQGRQGADLDGIAYARFPLGEGAPHHPQQPRRERSRRGARSRPHSASLKTTVGGCQWCADNYWFGCAEEKYSGSQRGVASSPAPTERGESGEAIRRDGLERKEFWLRGPGSQNSKQKCTWASTPTWSTWYKGLGSLRGRGGRRGSKTPPLSPLDTLPHKPTGWPGASPGGGPRGQGRGGGGRRP